MSPIQSTEMLCLTQGISAGSDHVTKVRVKRIHAPPENPENSKQDNPRTT